MWILCCEDSGFSYIVSKSVKASILVGNWYGYSLTAHFHVYSGWQFRYQLRVRCKLFTVCPLSVWFREQSDTWDLGSCLPGSALFLVSILLSSSLGCSETSSFKVRKIRIASIGILASFQGAQVWLSNHGWLCPFKKSIMFHKHTFSLFAFFHQLTLFQTDHFYWVSCNFCNM